MGLVQYRIEKDIERLGNREFDGLKDDEEEEKEVP
jgi:hypothetical protein